MPPGAAPMGPAPLPDPRAMQREAILQMLGGPQVVPGDPGTRTPEGVSTEPRPFWPQDSTKRGSRY